MKYSTKRKAEYNHSVKVFNKFVRYSLKVNVIGETKRSYFIELLEPTQRRNVGECIFVRKKCIRFLEEEKKSFDYSNFWYNK